MNEETLVRKLAEAVSARWEEADELVEMLAELEPSSALNNLDRVRKFVVDRIYASAAEALTPPAAAEEPALAVIVKFAATHIERGDLKLAISARWSDARLRRAAKQSLARLAGNWGSEAAS